MKENRNHFDREVAIPNSSRAFESTQTRNPQNHSSEAGTEGRGHERKILTFAADAKEPPVRRTDVPGISADQYQRVINLIRSGKTVPSIAPQMRLPYSLVYLVIRDYIEQSERRLGFERKSGARALPVISGRAAA